MKEGDVIIVPMPQADGMVKNRPAIILREMIRYRTESGSVTTGTLAAKIKRVSDPITLQASLSLMSVTGFIP